MNKLLIICAAGVALSLGACASTPGAANVASTDMSFYSAANMTAPDPIEGNSGKYMSPYTSDDVVAEWVDKGMSAKLGSSLGSTAGQMAAGKLASNIPMFGSLLGRKAGEAVGRKMALEAIGGKAFLRESSDLSFNSLEKMSVYLFVEHGHRENYAEVLAATQEIYPDLKTVYYSAIASAGT